MIQNERRNGEGLEPRCQILVEYAKWTALSAVRAGGLIKAKEPVYQLLDGVAFSKVFDQSLGPISCKDFNDWHECQTVALSKRGGIGFAGGSQAIPPYRLERQADQRLPQDDRLRWRSRPRGPSRRAASAARQRPQERAQEALQGVQRTCRAEVNFGWIKDITDYDRYRRVNRRLQDCGLLPQVLPDRSRAARSPWSSYR